MTLDDPAIFGLVPITVAAERSGLNPAEILVLTIWEEPSGLDGAGPIQPVIRSSPSDSGLLVNLADATEMAPAFRAIMAEGGDA